MLNVPTVFSPVVRVLPKALEVGEVPVGKCAKATILITNHNGCHLHISDIHLEDATDPGFHICRCPHCPAEVTSECCTEVELTFCPNHSGSASGSLEIDCDDPVKPVLHVALHGTGV